MWAGKHESVRSLLRRSRGTLIPGSDNSVGFDTAESVFIEGDNLEVLKLLQKAYNDRVKLIYIDPPYNTGNDFVYNDRIQLELAGSTEAAWGRGAETLRQMLDSRHGEAALDRLVSSLEELLLQGSCEATQRQRDPPSRTETTCPPAGARRNE